MIVCLRTVAIPPEWRTRYLEWIAAGRKIREEPGILAELVCEPKDQPAETVVITLWPSQKLFDAWIATPHRDALSTVHQAVIYWPITRYEVTGGYLNLPSLAVQDLTPRPINKGDVMTWVTRARPKTDRIACPWLIRRFVDPDAQILYVPAAEVLSTAEREGALSFDAPGARYDHRDGKCTFEVLIDEHGLGSDPALARLAQIVHAADFDSALHTDPLGPGLLAIGLGGLDVEADDQVLMARASFVYDALYAWCQQQTGTQHAAQGSA